MDAIAASHDPAEIGVGPIVLTIHLLHAPRLTLASGAAHALERKDAALLALLAMDGPWTAARAAGLLWPDSPDGQARTNLRQRLFRLRKLAGADVVNAQGNLHLAPGLQVDVLALAQSLPDEPGVGAGELLGGLDYGDTGALERWVIAARARWRDQWLERLAARASELEGAQKIAAALVLAQRMVADDPLQEHAQRRVMRLHYLRGDRAAALTAYQHCKQVLRDELGARPSHETEQLAALIESSGALALQAPARPAVATLRPPRLVGREGPWRRLEEAWRGATPALVAGEAGIGKSRLLGDFAAAHGDAPVFGGRPGDASLPYALLARMVRGLVERFALPADDWVRLELARLAPELGLAAPGQLSVLRLQQAWIQALNGWRAAGLALLVVDDLHHADSASLELLPALVAAVAPPGVAWLLGVRHGELPAAVAPLIDGTPAPDRIELGPLDLAGVTALLASLALPGLDPARWAPPLAQHTGGNPLFLLETMIALLAEPHTRAHGLAGEPPRLPEPQRVGRLIEQRLAQLSPTALKLARVAAIAGQDFSAALAAQVLGARALDIADSWRELEAGQVIRDGAFAHDLIFEGTLRSIPRPIAQLLHHDVAVALQAAGAAPARLAAHWSAAQDWAAAGDAHVAAARAAFVAARRVEEAAWWDEAVRCYERAGDADKAFAARRDSVDTAIATRPSEGVLVHTEALLSAARSDAQRLDALLAHGKTLVAVGRRPDAVVVADEAIALADALADPWQRFRAACLGAMSLSPGPRAAEGIARLRAFAPLLEAAGDALRRRDYYGNLADATFQAQRRREAAELYVLSVAAARAVGDTSEEVICTHNLGGLLLQLGRMQEGREHAERALRLLDRIGDPEGLLPAAVRITLAMCDASLGRLGPALQGLELAWRHLGSAGGTGHHAVCETHLAIVWLQLGQPARALQALTPIPAEAARPLAQRQVRRLTIEARLEAALGRPALPRLEQALQLCGPNTEPLLRMLAELDRSRERPPADAVADCDRVRREAETIELLALAARARVFRVDALRRAGDLGGAADAAREVAASWHACRPTDLYWPEALWMARQALHAAGDLPGSQALDREAADWIRDVARSHVPAAFQESFLHRNPVNRMILAAQGRT